MPPPSRDAYLANLHRATSQTRAPDWFRGELLAHAHAVQALLALDLEVARPALMACYASRRRGTSPRDPVVMLRVLLLAILVGEASLNAWVKRLRGSAPLRALAGLSEDDPGPGVGTLYDFLHRLHDGPAAFVPGAQRASTTERRRARAAQAAPSKRGRKTKKNRSRRGSGGKDDETADGDVRTAAAVVDALRSASDAANPMDLLGRLSTILFEVAVRPSAERGLLGDTSRLLLGGDGSTLPTGAQGRGTRTCDHPKFERCDCERIYADPDARVGWDTHRRCHFFGYRFYELSVSSEGHDLPVALRLDPGNLSDFVAGPRCIDHFRKTLRDRTDGEMCIDIVSLDAGHDARPIYTWLGEHDIRPVIPLSGKTPPHDPSRPDVPLSERGIPLCQAGVEMGAWGSAGPGRVNYICPLKTGLGRCPLAPDEDPTWRCRPELKHGPTVALRTSGNPRLFPAIHRNGATYDKARRLRSGTERSNGAKKGPYGLLDARHRRKSFWLIRLHLIAILQHAKAWVRGVDDVAAVEAWLAEVLPAKAA